MAVKFLNGINVNNKNITNLADASNPTDAVTKQQMDNLVSGLAYKNEVRVATTANGTLSTAFANAQTIDGITLATNDRILIKNQTTQTENGIYVVQAAGAPVRATDADSTAELNNATVYVTVGTVNGGLEYTQTTANPTIGTNNIVWAQKSTGSTYTADGQGIEVSTNQFTIELDGTTLSKSASGLRIGSGAAGAGLTEASGVLAVGTGTGITVAADAISVDTSVVPRKFAANCVATTNPQTFTHNFNTLDVIVQVVEVAGSSPTVEADVTRTGVNTISVEFGAAPSASQFRVLVMG